MFNLLVLYMFLNKLKCQTYIVLSQLTCTENKFLSKICNSITEGFKGQPGVTDIC